jgi:hypothetical protein
MPTERTPLQRPHRLPLSHEAEMSLRYGELTGCPGFASAEERKAAWFAHRDELLRHCRGGKRPSGWWDYECPIPYPRDRDYAEAALYEAELLTEGEVAELTAHWRKEFERAQDPRFMHCIGHAKPGDTFATWLKGAAARRAHYRWAGIPRDLLKRWMRERRRRSRTIRELEAVRPRIDIRTTLLQRVASETRPSRRSF